jgi:hypothetical protein
MDVDDLFVDLTISNQPVAGSIILSGSKEFVFVDVYLNPSFLTFASSLMIKVTYNRV